MAKKSSFTISAALAVDEYFRDRGDYDEDKEAAFALAARSRRDAVEYVKDELKEAGVRAEDMAALRFEAKFVEFDSGNLSHAGACYEVEASGPPETVARALAAYRRLVQDNEPEQLDMFE